MSEITIRALNGQDVLPYIDELAKLRIAVFREWPYLYDGNTASEYEYLEVFAQETDSFMALAFDGAQVVGASTAMPMAVQLEEVMAPWRDAGYDLSTIGYYGESVLLPAYRSRGIGVAFFEYREAFARSRGFGLATFCGVVRPADHPLRPAGYRPLDAFWNRRGFEPTDLYCRMSWQDIDEPGETHKPLRFWEKKLS